MDYIKWFDSYLLFFCFNFSDERFVEITVVFQGYHGYNEAKSLDPVKYYQEIQTNQDYLYVCNYRYDTSTPTGLNIKKKIISPAGLFTITFTSTEIFFASPHINDNLFQIVTSADNIASVDNMKKKQSI